MFSIKPYIEGNNPDFNLMFSEIYRMNYEEILDGIETCKRAISENELYSWGFEVFELLIKKNTSILEYNGDFIMEIPTLHILNMLSEYKDALDYFKGHKTSEQMKVDIKSNANEKHHFTLNIENASKNVFAITNIESENDDTFKEGNWVFILFAGYSGLDIKFVKEFILITTEFPNLNFAFKPYMDDEKIQEFTQVNIERKRTPVIILKKNNDSKLLSDTTKDIEKIKTVLYSIE